MTSSLEGNAPSCAAAPRRDAAEVFRRKAD
jgi:hypothetical protein